MQSRVLRVRLGEGAAGMAWSYIEMFPNVTTESQNSKYF
jgi:hypothetical protein